jgi:hypothetical protein
MLQRLDTPQGKLVRMEVGVDKSWQHYPPARIDHLAGITPDDFLPLGTDMGFHPADSIVLYKKVSIPVKRVWIENNKVRTCE